VYKNKFYLIVCVISGILVLTSCNKKPEIIGLDLVDNNKIPVNTAVFSVSAFSSVEDSVLTDETTINLLGCRYSETFGLTVASIYTHLRLSQLSPDFGDVLQPDSASAFLTLVYTGYYGNISTPQTVRIYEITEDFYADSTYYSKSSLDVSDIELASYTFFPNPDDSVSVNDSTKVAAELRIPLESEFINKILFPQDTSVLTSNENFIEYFKGIYITIDSRSALHEGAILYFNLLDTRSKVTIYYNDSLSFDLVFNQNTARFGNFYHNYSMSTNQNFLEQIYLNDTTKGNQGLYLQGLAGIKTTIRIPSLQEWVNTNNYVINEAKLIIPAYESGEYLLPADKLLLFKLNESGYPVFTTDQLEGDNYFGGSLNDSTYSYQFRLSFYIQELLNGAPDYGLVMYMSGKTIKANETLLYGTDPSLLDLKRMELRIIYTVLN
jgi:hypothetical protein